MSFFTSACDLPQKLHMVMLVGRAISIQMTIDDDEWLNAGGFMR